MAAKRTVVCSFEQCDLPAEGKGLCIGHYRQLKRGSSLRPLRKKAPAGTVKPYITAALASRDRANGCWIDWPHGLSSGRPTLRHDGRRVLVAPYVVWCEVGVWPECACHTCDVGECWNPGHIYAGTMADNARDRDERERSANQCGPWPRFAKGR